MIRPDYTSLPVDLGGSQRPVSAAKTAAVGALALVASASLALLGVAREAWIPVALGALGAGLGGFHVAKGAWETVAGEGEAGKRAAAVLNAPFAVALVGILLGSQQIEMMAAAGLLLSVVVVGVATLYVGIKSRFEPFTRVKDAIACVIGVVTLFVALGGAILAIIGLRFDDGGVILSAAICSVVAASLTGLVALARYQIARSATGTVAASDQGL